MSRSNTTSFITRFLVLIVSLALVGADLVVLGQNANSSTTMQNDNMSSGNTNMSGGRRRRRSTRRRGRRRGTVMNTNAACGPMQENTNMAAEPQENANTGEANTNMNMGGGRRRRRGRRRGGNMNAAEPQVTNEITTARPVSMSGRCDPNTQEQTDLSGTYTGTVNYAEGGWNGDATLTINGNDFTLTSGSNTVEGRVVAVTTCNYTAVVMRLGKDPGVVPTLSLRARRAGSSLSLKSVPGESKQFSFNGGGASGSGSSGGRRRRRGRRRGGRTTTTTGNACNPMAHAIAAQ